MRIGAQPGPVRFLPEAVELLLRRHPRHRRRLDGNEVDLDAFVRAINRAEPGLIRVDADETTYSLHIILRFELEQELIAGAVELEDLPEIWNARMKEFLGVDVPSAGDGVHCYADDGTLIGKIHLPEVVANVEFGGVKRNRLYICATTSLFAVYLNTRAATSAAS